MNQIFVCFEWLYLANDSYSEPVLGIRDILVTNGFGSGSGLDPDPTPYLTSFFIDFKDAKKKFLIICQQAHHPNFFAKILCLNFIFVGIV
jgi:hypothetical protein